MQFPFCHNDGIQKHDIIYENNAFRKIMQMLNKYIYLTGLPFRSNLHEDTCHRSFKTAKSREHSSIKHFHILMWHLTIPKNVVRAVGSRGAPLGEGLRAGGRALSWAGRNAWNTGTGNAGKDAGRRVASCA